MRLASDPDWLTRDVVRRFGPYRAFSWLLGAIFTDVRACWLYQRFWGVKSEKTTQLDIGAQYNGKQLNSWVSSLSFGVSRFHLVSSMTLTICASARQIISTQPSWAVRWGQGTPLTTIGKLTSGLCLGENICNHRPVAANPSPWSTVRIGRLKQGTGVAPHYGG